MTISEIRRRAREQSGNQCNIDARDDFLIDKYICEGQAQMCGMRVPNDTPVLIENGSIPLRAVGELSSVVRVRDEAGRDVPFRMSAAELITKKNGLFTVTYLGAPDAPDGDDDEPVVPETLHGALADYATWRMLSSEGAAGQSRAQFFFARFQLACLEADKFFDGQAGARRIRNKYL